MHLCVDMQRMFAEETEWKMAWLERVLPNITTIAASHPEHTIFTRFIPAQKPGQGVGMWRHYYERWHSMTLDHLKPEMIDLVPDLAGYVPPARIFDNTSTRHGQRRTYIKSCAAQESNCYHHRRRNRCLRAGHGPWRR